MMTSLLTDLVAAGYPVGSVSELRTSGRRYRAAIPVLLHWLEKVSDYGEKQEIVRALSVPWAKVLAVEPLLFEFEAVPISVGPAGQSLRWAIGNGLEVLFDDNYLDAFVRLARDRRYGMARQMIVLALGKSRRLDAIETLLGLLQDPDVDGHAIKALNKLKANVPRDLLLAKAGDDRPWVRKEIQRALLRSG